MAKQVAWGPYYYRAARLWDTDKTGLSLQETGTVPWGVGVGVGAVGCPEGKYQIAQLLRYQAINTRFSRCWSSHLGSSWVNPETIPFTEGRERPRKEAATLGGEMAACTGRELPGGPSWGPQDE